jgi:hypothetical protein
MAKGGWLLAARDAVHIRHFSRMSGLISAGEAKTTNARSPIIPAPTITGLPGAGPSSLPSVSRCKLNSRYGSFAPSAAATW